ncbi:FixH family protein [Blastopirellula sp. JC732]|uniref:FixH family protein n=1 Tax=Blastopirellula sediminis TaxID=2894196 RepID=A0A9X1SIE1_9BACT|nr:FixH family protein [Blastopirellula sediminis]MCC9605548.1 FixH family protein [Blastopirellula sediminis]MCC9631152.1 FixH family protein [Blastopirellula sediminis]
MKSLSLTTFVLLLAVGCGSSDPNMIPISGSVSYQGKPITDGVVRFVPAENSSAPVRVAQVIDGSYELAGRFSLMPGTYQIQIEGFEGEDLPLSEAGQQASQRKQILPAQYNAKSKLEPLTVSQGDRAQQKDFELN